MPGLHLEKHKLIPNRRDAFFWDGLGLPFTIYLFDRIQLECASPFFFPVHGSRKGEVKDVRDASGTDNVVVVEKMTTFSVRVDGHVLFRAREWTTPGDCTKKCTKSGRI